MNDTITPRPPVSSPSLPGAPPRRRWQIMKSEHVLNVLSMLVTGSLIYLILDTLTPTQRERQACDRVVATLLDTRDLVELNRAVALAGLLGCNVSRRMPTPE